MKFNFENPFKNIKEKIKNLSKKGALVLALSLSTFGGNKDTGIVNNTGINPDQNKTGNTENVVTKQQVGAREEIATIKTSDLEKAGIVTNEVKETKDLKNINKEIEAMYNIDVEGGRIQRIILKDGKPVVVTMNKDGSDEKEVPGIDLSNYINNFN